MKLALKQFQEEVLVTLLEDIRQAQQDSKRRGQAVSLTAPTGAGKTIIVTAALERLVRGDADAGPDPNATFLWLSDQPELNEQTRRKFLVASDCFTPSTLRLVDAVSFDQRVFDAGVVYFLNTQKLGRDKTLVEPGDLRQYTIWDTIRNTVAEKPGSFFLVIDEAHRGMIEDASERSRANSIIQRFIKGDEVAPAVPLVIAISATPARFNRLVEGATGRTLRPIAVDPDQVRASGLLKDEIRFTYPKINQQTELTLLRDAARTLKAFDETWAAYSAAQRLSRVRPLLVVQVRDGGPGRLSDTNLTEVMSILRAELDGLPDTAFAHSFQERQAIDVGGRSVRYVAPVDIQDDPAAQVVFFKSALSTGWDCPRAEVMMSFRTTTEVTLIAQLIGRMVRTPLARSVADNELLNRVQLYLPHYDKKHVEDVIKYLTSDEGGAVPGLDVGEGDTVPAARDHSKDGCFDALGRITRYTIPTVRHANQVNRLMKLARLLAATGIDEAAVDAARGILLAALDAAHTAQTATRGYENAIAAGGKVMVVDRNRMADGTETETPRELDAASEDIIHFFENASRRLREGLAPAFVKLRVKAGVPIAVARLELIALTTDDVVDELNTVARDAAEKWQRDLARKIRKLGPADQAAFNDVAELAPEPTPTSLQPPLTLEVTEEEDRYSDHLYTLEDGTFPVKLNTWEAATLLVERRRADFAGWLRNPSNKPWALAIPYSMTAGGQYRSLYPDLIVFRRSDDEDITVDILDPHLLSFEDAAPKAAGLAVYAARHGRDFGRIELIRVEKKEIHRLDLQNPKTREKVANVSTNGHLRELFDAYASKEPLPDPDD